MWSGFEVIPPAIGDDSIIQNVELANAPSVEPRFQEQMLENTVIADLQVALSRSKSANAETPWNRAGVRRVGKPKHGGRIVAVWSGNGTRLKGFECCAEPVIERNGTGKGSFERLGVVVDSDVEHGLIDMGGEEATNIIRKRETGLERNGSDLAKVVAHGMLVQEVGGRVTVNAVHRHVEETVWPVAVTDTTNCGASPNGRASV